MTCQAQPNLYKQDVAAFLAILQKTPAYRTQIKGEKLKSYQTLYKRLASDSLLKVSDYQYFYNLAQLVFPLRDNHLMFYQIPNLKNFRDQASIDNFVLSQEFANYPQYNIDIDSLKLALTQKPAESIEGIYYYDKYYTVGLFKVKDKEYIGVVLESTTELWQKGQIAIHLWEFEPNMYKAIYGHPLTKNFLLHTIEKYRNQSLVNSYFYASYSELTYSKQFPATDYVNLPPGIDKFQFKKLAPDIQYLLVQTFQGGRLNSQNSQKFYETIKDSLITPNLILDLRDNEGGSEQVAEKYLQLIKNYAKKGNLYVLINNGTLSQAEIFLLALKKTIKLRVLGQTSKGMLAYGSNMGKREKLPSGKFEIYITDMKNKAEHLNYEDKGINPDIFLNNNKSWLEQAIEIIKEK
jgi:hypothetical protein